jgi:phosphoribosylglycinamide formyltransferase-1
MRSRIVVLISGGGTNLQAIIDASKHDNYSGDIVAVVSNKADVYGLTRAQDADIPTSVLSHKLKLIITNLILLFLLALCEF